MSCASDQDIMSLNSELAPLIKNKKTKAKTDQSCFCKRITPCFLMPQRYVMCIMAFFAVVNTYTMRICLNVAITEMATPLHLNNTHLDEHACPAPSFSDNSEPIMGGTYRWSSETQGLILSSFFYGYVVTHIPGGVLAEKFGGKYTLGLGILSTAIFTLLTPLAIQIGGSDLLIIVRVLEGLGEGTTFPAVNTLLAQWVPASERGRLGSFVYGGSQIGSIVGTALSGLVIHYTNSWGSVFYLFGGIGVLWFIIWVPLCYNDPRSHPFITDEEKDHLEKEIGIIGLGKDKAAIPWKAILSSAPLWALIVAQIGHDWGFFTMVTDLPKYMKDVLKFSISSNGIYSSLPYVALWIVSILSGGLCDWLVKNKLMTLTNARKMFTTIASIGPACFIIGASYAGCDKVTVVALFTIGMGFMGTFYPGIKVNALDLSPTYAGTAMALVNGIGALSGIVTPYLVGVLTPNHTLLEWRTAFWIVFGVFLVTNLVFVIWASGETQWWNDMASASNKFDLEKEVFSDNTKKDVSVSNGVKKNIVVP